MFTSEILILSASIFTTPAVADFYALNYSLDLTEQDHIWMEQVQ